MQCKFDSLYKTLNFWTCFLEFKPYMFFLFLYFIFNYLFFTVHGIFKFHIFKKNDDVGCFVLLKFFDLLFWTLTSCYIYYYIIVLSIYRISPVIMEFYEPNEIKKIRSTSIHPFIVYCMYLFYCKKLFKITFIFKILLFWSRLCRSVIFMIYFHFYDILRSSTCIKNQLILII